MDVVGAVVGKGGMEDIVIIVGMGSLWFSKM